MPPDTTAVASPRPGMPPTDVSDPQYFHKVVDCQYACPAHTPVPEYIRLIARGQYAAAYMLNWESNVFPGILGRTCDRPCEPACRRGRIEEKPVAICRLKRVAADFKGDVDALMPVAPATRNGRRVGLIGAGPASLTVARDLTLKGYECVVLEKDRTSGGLMRTNIPSFRLPASVLDEETERIIALGVEVRYGEEVTSLKGLLADGGFDAVFVGTGAPRGKDLEIPGRREASANIHVGIDWLTSVAFQHVDRIGQRVVVLGGGNTAMDCCRTALRLGGTDVRVTVRSPRKDMKASPWEIEDAEREGIPIFDNHNPVEFLLEGGRLAGVRFAKMRAEYDGSGRRTLVPTGDEVVFECDDVLMAIGQENAFPWIERDAGIEFGKWDMPAVDETTFMSSRPGVFFGGDAAWGPKNIIWAVAHGHQAALSIDLFCTGRDLARDRPPPGTSLFSQKMSIHEWAYDNDYAPQRRVPVPHAPTDVALKDRRVEVELGYDDRLALEEAHRCLNCDIQTVFAAPLCIECDACVDICPVDCITFTENGEETDLRARLRVPAANPTQDVYVSPALRTGRVMAKDEDVCLHCGLCAERCPTGAWDMKKYMYVEAQVSDRCLTHHARYLTTRGAGTR
ncbi:MAG TPA: FAD-dependent oxidoreductase [Gemmatimonadales bacterium]|nr:FAD-dependent oxidoreductase [Gemmatimonadales bacterium]